MSRTLQAQREAAPTVAPASQSEQRSLKRAFGAYPTGVTVVTTMLGEVPLGFTANSFTSVSIDPPLLLVCHGASASSHAIFREAEGFAVNVLSADQADLALRFASRIEDRFEGTAWRTGRGGPILRGTAAWLDCAMHEVHEAGDHSILIGRVLAHETSERTPLLYSRGQFLPCPGPASG